MGIEPVSAAAEGWDQVQKRVCAAETQTLTNREQKKNAVIYRASEPLERWKRGTNFLWCVSPGVVKRSFFRRSISSKDGGVCILCIIQAVTFAPHNDDLHWKFARDEASAWARLQSTSSKCACSPYLWRRRSFWPRIKLARDEIFHTGQIDMAGPWTEGRIGHPLDTLVAMFAYPLKVLIDRFCASRDA